MFINNRPSINVQTPAPPEEEKESCFVGAVRLIAWSLLFIVIIGGAVTIFSGGSVREIIDNITQGGVGGNPGQGTDGQQQTGDGRNTEGGAAPTVVPGLPGDENPSTGPTAAVIWNPYPQPGTPWPYPVPTQTDPTQPPLPVESVCPFITGEIVWIEVRSNGLTPACFSLSPGQRIGIFSLIDVSVRVTLEDSSLQLAPGARSEFSEPVGILLAPGVHKLRADPYGSVDVWLEVR